MKKLLVIISVVLMFNFVFGMTTVWSLTQQTKKLETSLKQNEFNIAISDYANIASDLYDNISELKSNPKADLEKIKSNLKKIELRLTPSKIVETRGIWMCGGTFRNLKTRENVRKALTKLKKYGYNTIYPIMNVSKKITYDQYGYDLSTWKEDPFQVMLEEAHKLGIEVFAWGGVYVVSSRNVWTDWMKKNEDLLDRNIDGKVFWLREAWLSHSNPEARAFVKNRFVDFAKSYPELDGFNFDFIRFDVGGGYDKYSVDSFKKETGIDPFNIKTSKEAETWTIWQENQINTWLAETGKEIKEVNSDIALCADVMTVNGINKQNWMQWIENGYLDAVIPMDYMSNNALFEETILRQNEQIKNRVPFIPGNGQYEFKDPMMLADQLAISQKAFGSATYVYYKLSNGITDLDAIRLGAYRNDAVPVTTTMDKIFNAEFNYIRSKENIWKDRRIIRDSEIKWLNSKMSSIESYVKEDYTKYFEFLYDVKNMKKEVVNNINNENIQDFIKSALNELEDILTPRLYIQSRRGQDPVPLKFPDLTTKSPEVQKEIPSVDVLSTNVEPVIDGSEDAIWAKVNWSKPFVTHDIGVVPDKYSRVKILHKDHFLYVLYKCEEAEMSKVKSFDGEKDTSVYLGDSVEFFVRPNINKSDYFHFAMSEGGSVYDEKAFEKKWNGNIEVKTKEYDNYWLLEFKLDLDQFGIDLSETMGMNFCRNMWAGNPDPIYVCWSSTHGGYHTIERFGKVSLK